MDDNLIRIFKTKAFNNCFKSKELSNELLLNASDEICRGIVDANLGGNLYKKRIAIGNKGKSGGIRTILVYQKNKSIFFLYGFKKNERANITSNEKLALRKIGNELLNLDDKKLVVALKHKEISEINYGKK